MGSTTDEINADNRISESDSDDIQTDNLRFGIESTRSGMSETVDAIQAKLSPQNVQETAEQITERAKHAALEVAEQTTERVKQAALDVSEQVAERMKQTVTQLKNDVKNEIHDATIGRVERMVDNMRDTTRGASASIMEVIKTNPIPSALVGIGLAWLYMNKSNGSNGSPVQQRYYPQALGQMGNQYQGEKITESVQRKADQVMDTVSEAADNVKAKAGEFVDQAQTQVTQLSSRVHDQAQEVVTRSQSMLEENPLITSALALTLGAAVGLLLPETRREDELMGEARNKLLGQVSEVAHDTMEKAQKVATEVLHVTEEKVQQEVKNQGSMSKKPV